MAVLEFLIELALGLVQSLIASAVVDLIFGWLGIA